MKLLRLNSTFNPDLEFDTFYSLIWTDRYRKNGDFELKTANINAMRALLPLGSFVGIDDTYNSIMIVENHLIEIDDNTHVPMLTISGRSLETFLENRVARPSRPSLVPLNDWDGTQDASVDWIITDTPAYLIARTVISAACIGSDLMYGNDIPGLTVITNTTNMGTPENQTVAIKPGHVYERVLELLAIDDCGIEPYRNRGDGASTPNLRIYKGADLTNSVVFSALLGDFTKMSYLWSTVGFKNEVWGYSYYTARVDNAVNYVNVSGFDRRTAYLDNSDIKAKNPAAADSAYMHARNRTFLAQNTKTTTFDFEVSPTCRWQYGTDYYLGDYVKVKADYGISENMVVAEYIRSQDSQGERAYPTLAIDAS